MTSLRPCLGLGVLLPVLGLACSSPPRQDLDGWGPPGDGLHRDRSERGPRPDGGAPRTYDVVVVGAGTGGVAAAIQAARLGARVALLEETSWVGGQATAAAVSSMDTSGALEADYGLYGELIAKVRSHYQALGKSIGTCYWAAISQCFEPKVGKDKLLELVGSAPAFGGALDLFTRTTVAAVLKSGNRVTGVRTGAGEVFLASVVIDATEYGDLLPLAGARYRVGNGTSDAPSPSACVQDITYVAITRKYPLGLPPGLAIVAPPPGYAGNKPQFARVITKTGSAWFGMGYPYDFGTHAAYRGTPDSSAPGSYTAGSPAAAAAITKSGVNWANDYPALNTYNPEPGVVNPRMPVRYLEDAAYRAQANCEARLKTLQFIHYMQTELGQPLWSVANDEGFDPAACPNIPSELKAVEGHLPPIPYVRESRRLIGLATLTAKEMVPEPGVPRGVLQPSAVAVGGYGNDLHNCSEDSTLESTLESRADVSTGRVFQIPFAAFIPETLDGFLPAEKNFSQSRLANGATRLQPTTMATGQAMGALAALAVKRGVDPRQIKAVLVQDALVKAGARISLYRFGDVLRSSPLWAAVELASARGLMIGDGSNFTPGDPLSRALAAVVMARLLGLPTSAPPATPSFQDVPATHAAYAAVEALKQASLTSGCSTSPPLYCPDAPLERASLAVFLARGLALDTTKPPATPTFQDVPASHWAYGSVEAIAKAGIMSSCGAPASFCPADTVTRGAMAQTLRPALLLGQ